VPTRSNLISFDTPVLVIGFNRPDKILSLLHRLSELGVTNLFISLDGPRSELEASVCEETRRQVEIFQDQFELSLVSRDYNLGCNLGVVSALDWFFQQNYCGIVLEDDCYPDDSMLLVLEEKLGLIGRSGGEIGMITAHNPFSSWPSKVLSRYALIQGWGTTSEVWSQIRRDYFKITSPQLSVKKRSGRSLAESIFWWANSNRARLGGVDTWDGIFADRLWRLGFQTYVPERNLIRNFGFDERATHTKNPNHSILIEVEENEKTDFDELMKSRYYKIHPRHLFTAPLKVILDVLSFNRKNFESVLKIDQSARRVFRSTM
jgi:hypothetical protein